MDVLLGNGLVLYHILLLYARVIVWYQGIVLLVGVNLHEFFFLGFQLFNSWGDILSFGFAGICLGCILSVFEFSFLLLFVGASDTYDICA